PVHLDLEAPGMDHLLVTRPVAPREGLDRPVDAPLPLPEPARPQHRLQVRRDRVADVPEHDREDRAEQRDPGREGVAREDAPADGVVGEAVPEHAGHVEAPEQAAGAAHLGGVRRADRRRRHADAPQSTAMARSVSRKTTIWATSRVAVRAGRHSVSRSLATAAGARAAMASVATKPGTIT